MSRQRAWTDEQLVEAVKSTTSMRSCISTLGLIPTGGNYSNIERHIKRLNLDTSHWTGQSWLKGKSITTNPGRSLREILVENSTHTSTHSLKQRLIKEGLLENKCAICGIDEWLGKSLALQLDHKNGINNDYRIENLRLLCPNCDSQQATYKGKNKRLKREQRETELLRSLGLIE